MIRKVAYQGEPGAHSDYAIKQLFGDKAASIGFDSFEEVFKAVKHGSVDVALVPIENTLGGSIHLNFDLLLRYNDLFIVGESQFRISNCLLALPGLERKDIKKVISHPQALAQCDDYCRLKGYIQEVFYDTAGSAKRLAQRRPEDKNYAAIANRLAASIYGLEIIDEDIQDDKNNFTRFIVISTTPCLPPPPTPSKTSIVFSLIDQTGALHKALSVFVLRQINMTKIESRPGRKHLLVPSEYSDPKIKNSPIATLNTELKIIHQTTNSDKEIRTVSETDYQNLFYLDIQASLNEIRCHNSLRHLAEIAPFIRVLGCYPIAGVYMGTTQYESELIYANVPTVKAHKLKVGIIGFSRFGQFLVKHFLQEGHDVRAVNFRTDYTRDAVLLGLMPNTTYFQGQSSIAKFFAQSPDVVIIATSIISFESVLQSILPYLNDQLVVDVLSVKKHPKILLEKLTPPQCDVLCTHPMFGPDSGAYSWVGLPFIYEKIRTSNFHRTSRFLSFFEDKGCRMVPMTCEEHDRIASGTQFVTHLTGRVLSGLNLEPTAIDTKGYQMLHTVTKSTTRDSFDLFFGLYKHNDFSSQQLLLMEKALYKVKSDLIDYEEKLGTEKKSRNTKSIVYNPRVESLAPSKTTRVTDIASEMKQKGIDVITLSVGEPDFQPPEAVMNALNEAIKAGLTKYTPLVGTPALRKAIADYLLREKKIKYSPEEIICSCGAKQSIFQAVISLCRPGDDVLIPAPFWVSYSEIVKFSGASTKIIPTTAKTNYCLTPEQLSNEITENSRLLILCNPSNPTGHVYDVAQLEKIAAVLRKNPHVYILADEIYEKILYDAKHVAFASLEGMWDRTITVNGFSKSHAMTGLRLGYLAAPKPIVSACSKVQSHITTCPASIVQHAGVVALEKTPPEYFTKAIAGFREKRDLVLSEFSKMGMNVPVPQGAFYVFFDVGQFLTKSVPTSDDLCVYLLEKFHIALVPGEAFGMNNHIRLSYAIALDKLREALKRLSNGLNSLKQTSAL